MAMGTLADLEDQDPIPGKENPLKIHLKVRKESSWSHSSEAGRMHDSTQNQLL